MRSLLKPLLLPFLRRDPGEVERQARFFSVESAEGREIVTNVGRAFLGGYNTMLEASETARVREAAEGVDPHFRPFFFEGAAMGYLPRAYFTRSAGPRRAEETLLAIDPRFRYLYYVGIGFWFGFRHRRRPAALEAMAAHVDPMYFPLCYDGYGFKLGFFDLPSRGAPIRRLLDAAPAARRAALYQGFGRALHFVCMEDESRFRTEISAAPPERRSDIEFGRSLAFTFTGLRRPERILRHIDAAGSDDERNARALGATWALTAREMNDADHFERCLGALSAKEQLRLRDLPRRCREALGRSRDYFDWQSNTLAAITEARRG